eukprot:TRINITY_DN29375_c0_g1_i1.p1 TRINITY_DN29375_c0_g1~~TRINITY_DN29375_c0_g1_i1.p1  ORF type:complete len:298 (+),score=51.69 TRINITY_DN29375_c0_g1_i1:140-1033(+)
MSRSFVNAQAGRAARAPALPSDAEPWGTTSNSVMRAYEPAEMAAAKGVKAGLRTTLQPSMAAKTCKMPTGPEFKWRRHHEAHQDPGPAGVAAMGKLFVPLSEQVAHKPVRWRPYVGLATLKQEDEAEALKNRQRAFPYRDEFHPRSKRLMYEMALEKCCRDSVASASTYRQDDNASCFTLASTRAGGTQVSKAGSQASRLSRTSSEPSRLPTGGSQRVVGGVAKRRMQCNLRSPMQSADDAIWFMDKFDKEGPAGLTNANCPAWMAAGSLKAEGDRVQAASALLPGFAETTSRKAGM